MRRGFLAAAIAAAFVTVAQAQSPTPAGATMSVPADLMNRVYFYLQNGGTFAEAQGLREALLFNAQSGQREADVQRRVDAAVADALKKAATKPAEPAPTAD